MPTKAMIFAAGLGSRLRPLTDNLPKALIPVNQKPLLEYVILKLRSEGIEKVIINTDHIRAITPNIDAGNGKKCTLIDLVGGNLYYVDNSKYKEFVTLLVD